MWKLKIMKKYIRDILKQKEMTFSFEFFPPKTDEGYNGLRKSIQTLNRLEPDFISVTYGAGGTTRDRTNQLVREIQEDYNIISMAHLTCVNSTREEIQKILNTHKESGILNIMALRGDPPLGREKFEPVKNGFHYASELIEFIKKSFDNQFSIGAAAYPEKHPEARTIEEDIENLKKKVDIGVEFLITQLFFDNHKFFDFRNKILKKGIDIPLLAGIMPITNYQQIERFTRMANCSIPETLQKKLELYKDSPEDLKKFSIEFSTKQCEDLIQNGVKGLHFYTLNQSDATFQILWEIKQKQGIHR